MRRPIMDRWWLQCIIMLISPRLKQLCKRLWMALLIKGHITRQGLQGGAFKWNIKTIIKWATGLLQRVIGNWDHPDNENQLDGRTETVESNIFKSSQSKVLFSNPANQISSTKQWNLIFFVVVLMCDYCVAYQYICQAQTVKTFACLNWITCICFTFYGVIGWLVYKIHEKKAV